MMKTQKQHYESPQMEVVHFHYEGPLCASGEAEMDTNIFDNLGLEEITFTSIL